LFSVLLLQTKSLLLFFLPHYCSKPAANENAYWEKTKDPHRSNISNSNVISCREKESTQKHKQKSFFMAFLHAAANPNNQPTFPIHAYCLLSQNK